MLLASPIFDPLMNDSSVLYAALRLLFISRLGRVSIKKTLISTTYHNVNFALIDVQSEPSCSESIEDVDLQVSDRSRRMLVLYRDRWPSAAKAALNSSVVFVHSAFDVSRRSAPSITACSDHCA